MLEGYRIEGEVAKGQTVNVINEETGEAYVVEISPRGVVRGSCPGFRYRGYCKHVKEVESLLQEKEPEVYVPKKKLRKEMTPAEKEEARIPLGQAMEIWEEVSPQLDGLQEHQLAGSIGRSRATVHDIDVVAAGDPAQVIKSVQAIPGVEVVQSGAAIIRFTYKGVMIDITFVGDPDEWGASTMYRTGPAEFNMLMRARAKRRGMRLNEHGLFNAQTGDKVAGGDEKGIFEGLEVAYITPQERENITFQTGLPVTAKLEDSMGEKDLTLADYFAEEINTQFALMSDLGDPPPTKKDVWEQLSPHAHDIFDNKTEGEVRRVFDESWAKHTAPEKKKGAVEPSGSWPVFYKTEQHGDKGDTMTVTYWFEVGAMPEQVVKFKHGLDGWEVIDGGSMDAEPSVPFTEREGETFTDDEIATSNEAWVLEQQKALGEALGKEVVDEKARADEELKKVVHERVDTLEERAKEGAAAPVEAVSVMLNPGDELYVEFYRKGLKELQTGVMSPQSAFQLLNEAYQLTHLEPDYHWDKDGNPYVQMGGDPELFGKEWYFEAGSFNGADAQAQMDKLKQLLNLPKMAALLKAAWKRAELKKVAYDRSALEELARLAGTLEATVSAILKQEWMDADFMEEIRGINNRINERVAKIKLDQGR